MLKAGTRIQGKWTGSVFQIEQPLGVGANGEVYLVRSANGRAAMKVCARSADIALEWALLEKLSPASQAFPRPMLIDDEAPNTFFYVMEWVPGDPLHLVLPRLNIATFSNAVEQVLQALAELHATGHAFCDLKPENILVSTSPQVRVRFVDVGGITPFNRSVRQFTPYYDRAFWGLGSRRAEPAYDLVACAVAIVVSVCGAPPSTLVNKTPHEREVWLEKSLKKFPYSCFTPLLRDVFAGHITDAGEFCTIWKKQPRTAVRHRSRTAATVAQTPGTVNKGFASTVAVHSARKQKKRDWTEWLMWVSLGTAATVTLTAWATFLGWLGP